MIWPHVVGHITTKGWLQFLTFISSHFVLWVGGSGIDIMPILKSYGKLALYVIVYTGALSGILPVLMLRKYVALGELECVVFGAFRSILTMC